MQMFEDASVPMEKEMGEPSRSDAENVWKTFYWRKVEKKTKFKNDEKSGKPNDMKSWATQKSSDVPFFKP